MTHGGVYVRGGASPRSRSMTAVATPPRGRRERSRSRNSAERFPLSQNLEVRAQTQSQSSRSPVSVSSYYEDDVAAFHFQVIGTGHWPRYDKCWLRLWQMIGELREQVARRRNLDPDQLQLYCQGVALCDTAVIREMPCYSAVARYPLRPDEASENRRFDEEARFMEDERHRALRDLRAWTTEDLFTVNAGAWSPFWRHVAVRRPAPRQRSRTVESEGGETEHPRQQMQKWAMQKARKVIENSTLSEATLLMMMKAEARLPNAIMNSRSEAQTLQVIHAALLRADLKEYVHELQVLQQRRGSRNATRNSRKLWRPGT